MFHKTFCRLTGLGKGDCKMVMCATYSEIVELCNMFVACNALRVTLQQISCDTLRNL